MPQLTDRFGPIQQQVILNGSGNGQVTFQPNGSNARITNLFVKVATSAAQAQCFMYKGQVADSTLIQNTNSGSTGAAAQGSIDLMDGETLYVVWTGGDPGAVATATFVGNTIPFDQIGSTNITWEDPIAAGDGSLVYPQMKSPDFQTSISGWILRRDGSVEFGSAVIRGSVSAAGGNVVLNDFGIRVVGTAGDTELLINRSGGFAARNIPDDGNVVQVFPGTINIANSAVTSISLGVGARIVNQGTGMDYSSSQLFASSTAVTLGLTRIASGFINYPIAFPVGRTLMGWANITNGAGTADQWHARWVPQDNTKCQVFLFNANGGPAAVTLNYNIHVFII